MHIHHPKGLIAGTNFYKIVKTWEKGASYLSVVSVLTKKIYIYVCRHTHKHGKKDQVLNGEGED